VTTTRRQVLEGISATALTAAALAGWTSGARAQTVDLSGLMTAGPLGEKELGDANAPVTIIEYASMTCGHCANFHATVYPALKEKYIDTGKVRFIFREFPLDPLSTAVFMLARCAPEDKYFDFVDLLFSQQNAWLSPPDNDRVAALLNISRQVGFTQESFEACLTNQKLLDGVNWVKNRGSNDFGVEGTPSFFVNGEMMRGARDINAFEEIINKNL